MPNYPTIPLEPLQSAGVFKEICEKSETRAGVIILSAKGSAIWTSLVRQSLSRGQSNPPALVAMIY